MAHNAAMPLILALALQAATSATAAPPPKFSILYDPCKAPAGSQDVVVCGKDGTASDRLPLPDDAPPTPNYVKPDSRDYRDNAMNHGTPCAAVQGGCQVGFGPPIVPAIVAAVNAIGNARKDHKWAQARARDGDRRQSIDLSDAKPAGRLEP